MLNGLKKAILNIDKTNTPKINALFEKIIQRIKGQMSDKRPNNKDPNNNNKIALITQVCNLSNK